MHYKNFKQLNGKTLRNGDTVDIFGVQYDVRISFLSNSQDNSECFQAIGVNPDTFCTKIYGYEALVGNWPQSNNYDYEALTRVVLALYAVQMGWKAIQFGKKVISLDEAKQYIPKVIMLGSYQGLLMKDFLKVGCQEIPYTIVEELYKTAVRENLI